MIPNQMLHDDNFESSDTDGDEDFDHENYAKQKEK
jgi:hypothetical protein